MAWSKFECEAYRELQKAKKIIKTEGKIVSSMGEIKSFDDMLSQIQQAAYIAGCKRKNDLIIIEQDLLLRICRYDYINFFIDDIALYEFLGTTSIKDLDALSHSVESYGSTRQGVVMRNVDEPDLKWKHIKTLYGMVNIRDSRKSIFFNIQERDKKTWNVSVYDGEDIATTNTGEKKFIPEDNSYGNSSVTAKMLKTICNMFLYIRCFPESITDCPPDDYKMLNQYTARLTQTRITSNESIIDRSGPVPHFRRGHFRRLTSDYYTKKKGQVVFVHSSFVKGKAKTIIDNPEKEELFL